MHKIIWGGLVFNIDFDLIMLPALIAIAAGGVVFVFIYPLLSGAGKSEKRFKKMSRGRQVKDGNLNLTNRQSGQVRRKQLQDTLKEIETKQKVKTQTTMRMRLDRAGLKLQVKEFYIMSAILSGAVFLVMFFFGMPVFIALIASAVAGLGIPRWFLAFSASRRQKKFVEEFANGIDIIVRGVKSGLPLNDCLKIIAAESQEPMRSEFVEVVEQLRVGLSVPQALEKLYERIPIDEVNFFTIVITIQQSSGGNLAEALGNLSAVLRDRKKLKGKIQAFSAEAKSSAAIIGALPLVVMLLVYFTTPDYISVLWTHQLGHIMLLGSAIWMMLGIVVMSKMINFDY